jgi:hypothetical protein
LHAERVRDIEAEAAASMFLIGKIGELASVENKTEKQKRELMTLVNQLNAANGELNLTYLYIPYKALGGNGTIDRLVEEMKKLPIKPGAYIQESAGA